MDVNTLITKSKNGDREAFGLLVVQFRQMVFRLAFRLLCDRGEAEDAVQDTFVKAWLSLKKYDPAYGFSTWIYRIAANVCYDSLRAGRRRATDGTLPAEYLDTAPNAEGMLINEELKQRIISLTEGLSPKQKLVFTLSDLEGLSADEIVAVTGFSPSGIKSNLYLARKHIRNKL